jgi:NADH-quinone oxidoreductase subunit L
MRWPLWALAVPSLALGLIGIEPGWLPELLDGGDFSPTAMTTVLGTGLAVLGIAAGYGAHRARPGADPGRVLLGPLHGAARNGFHLDALYRTVFVRPVLAAARLTRFLDRDVIETYVRGTAGGARLLGTAVRGTQTGNVQTYLGVLLTGVVVIGILVVI